MRIYIACLLSLFICSIPFASIAEAKWKCKGADYVCNSNSYTKKKVYNSKKVYKKKRYTKKKTYKKYASSLVGKASYYWQPQGIACGPGRFNPNAMTAAHKTLPCGTVVRVTNQRNGKSVTVKINDRGPYIKGRIIDLSKAAAQKISMTKAGVVPVTVTVLK